MVNKTDGLTHTRIHDTDKIVCSANRIGDSMECAFRHVVRNTDARFGFAPFKNVV